MTDFTFSPNLADRVIIVTGGGRGLGRIMALALLEHGARVVITSARQKSELNAVEQEAEQVAEPGRLLAHQADVTNPDMCETVVAKTLETFGEVYGLINNAGRGMRLISETFNTDPTKFWEASVDAWKTIIDTNVNGAFYMSRAAAPHMIKAGKGTIINISTSTITMVRKGYSPYGASKAALEAFSRAWADDLEGTGVTVNVLLPGGATDTELLPPDHRHGADGKLLSPDLMVQPTLWLCSDEGKNVSGRRFIAKFWEDRTSLEDAVKECIQPAPKLPSIL